MYIPDEEEIFKELELEKEFIQKVIIPESEWDTFLKRWKELSQEDDEQSKTENNSLSDHTIEALKAWLKADD